jgi:catechol 2,3-dioxygenase-like lactoylglutathione lyase family enzyme
VYAERGTLSFFWRARESVGKTEFPIFRVGYADHSSWDMVWLRIDYNGHGFDAFVTDANLARIRVSTTLTPFPKPSHWIHLAFMWDETKGIRFYVDGKLAAEKDSVTVLSAGLDQFGPHSRIIAPSQVQSSYNFQRGGDIDEIRIYDRMLSDANIERLAKGESAGEIPALARNLNDPRWNAEWRLRYGWNRPGDRPPVLDCQFTRVRKVEIENVYDLKRWWWKATDGIRETTWPGVYNRSRLPGRNDYFQLPDWDCYSLSGKSVIFFMPDELWNHLEISGAAWGTLTLLTPGNASKEYREQVLFERPKSQEKTFHRLPQPVYGEMVRFTNAEQEPPIGELSAYYVDDGKEPAGVIGLSYSLTDQADRVMDQLKPVIQFIDGRYLPDERAILIAVPGKMKSRKLKNAGTNLLPIVHILVPYDSRSEMSGNAKSGSSYAWDKIDGGLDGIAIDLPALNIKPKDGECLSLNIRILDPIWPMRAMLDFSFSVKPGEPHTLWLDTRDRILPKGKCLYMTIAGSEAGFNPKALQTARVRTIFKPRQDAYREHVQDRFTQVRDNYANLSEERANDPRLNLYKRFQADLADLLHIDPKHYPGQNYRYDADQKSDKPKFVPPAAPTGIPLWAFLQTEDLRYFKRFVLWWINNRQISNGELGGGLSDDDDLTNCWPGAALMGCEPERIGNAVLRLSDAIYAEGMLTDGLPTIQTDGLHAHEEGIETQTQAMLVDYGNPKRVERIMETVRTLEDRLMLKNKAGHRHFRSSYFSGTKVADESVWEWSLQPQEFLLLQPVLTLAEYNGNPRALALATEMADGLLAHSRKDKQGRTVFDTEINFATDSARPSPLGSEEALASSVKDGAAFSTSSAGLQLLWAAYRLTGQTRYLQPLLEYGDGIFGIVSGDAFDLLNLRSALGGQIVEKTDPRTGLDLFRHLAWQMTGKKAYLENYYADQIEESALREYINTEGSLWSDRVFAANRELQRSRLGGVALVRGAIYSGHTVSWKFKAPANDESVAILVPVATPSTIKIIAYDLAQKPVEATMTAWDVQPGTWELKQGLDLNGDEEMDSVLSTRLISLERSGDVPLSFAPHATTILSLNLKESSLPYRQRPDLGIGREDIALQEKTITVKVHSLGSLDAPPSTLALVENGKTLASAAIPAIAAPLDLIPKYAEVSLTVPPNAALRKCAIRIDPEKKLSEVTRMNNTIDLNESGLMTSTMKRKKTDDQITELEKKPRAEHIAFNVKDPAAVAQWYCVHLGMMIVRKSPPPANTHFIGDSSGNMMLELYHNADVPVLDFASISHMAMHLAFMVDSIQAMRDSLLAAGATLVEDVNQTPAGDRVLMMRDPWGLAIQFVKRISPMLTPSGVPPSGVPPAGVRPEHIAFNIPDPQSTANWYCENLGMKVVRSGGSPTYTMFIADAGKHMMMELFHNSAYPMIDWPAVNYLSFHFAFMVEDVRAVRNSLIAAGATLAEDVRVTNTGDEVLMLRDPWGKPIQFLKRGEPMWKW